MAMLGLKSDPAHHSYLTRFAEVEPNMVITADADKIVKFYRKWASEENWVTVGDLETKLKKWASGLRLSDLEHVSVATNDEGHFVALVSTKSNLDRQRLMRDLGRGVLVSERLGPVTIHEGFVGNSQPVKFAILNPKTMVIGDPRMTMQFISAPAVSPDGPPENHPTVTLSKSPKDLLSFYHTRNGLESIANWFSGPLRPSIDRLIGFIKTDASAETQLLTQIGGDLRVDATFTFDEQSDAETFAKSWRNRANRQLGMFTNLLCPRTPSSFDGVAQDLDQCTITTPGNEAKVTLATTNRWATLGSGVLKDTLVHLVESLQQNRPVDQTPSLISPEETEARSLAQQIADKCGLAISKKSNDIVEGQDLSKLITAMSRGVTGSGAYRNAEYRVAGADKMRSRLLQLIHLLEWQDGKLRVVLKDPPVLEDDGPAMAVKDEE